MKVKTTRASANKPARCNASKVEAARQVSDLIQIRLDGAQFWDT
jgi:hypothetical protein